MAEIKRFTTGALIIKDNKFLIIKRKADDFLPGIYELPGGKVKEGETIEQAMIREVKEETNLQVSRTIKKLKSFEYLSKSGKNTKQFNFLVEASGEIKLSEHEDYQ